MRLVEIGRRLRELRLARGYSQAELASLAGVTRSTLSRLENGTLSDLGATKLLALLELAGGVSRHSRRRGSPARLAAQRDRR